MPLVCPPGYYVGKELRVSRAEVSAHVAGRGPLGGRYLHGLYERHPRGGHALGQSKVLWDLINIAWLLEPSWFSAHTIPTPSLDAELRWVAHGPERHAMLEAVDVDRDESFADLYGCLEEHSVKMRTDPDAPPDMPLGALGPAARPSTRAAACPAALAGFLDGQGLGQAGQRVVPRPYFRPGPIGRMPCV